MNQITITCEHAMHEGGTKSYVLWRFVHRFGPDMKDIDIYGLSTWGKGRATFEPVFHSAAFSKYLSTGTEISRKREQKERGGYTSWLRKPEVMFNLDSEMGQADFAKYVDTTFRVNMMPKLEALLKATHVVAPKVDDDYMTSVLATPVATTPKHEQWGSW